MDTPVARDLLAYASHQGSTKCTSNVAQSPAHRAHQGQLVNQGTEENKDTLGQRVQVESLATFPNLQSQGNLDTQ